MILDKRHLVTPPYFNLKTEQELNVKFCLSANNNIFSFNFCIKINIFLKQFRLVVVAAAYSVPQSCINESREDIN